MDSFVGIDYKSENGIICAQNRKYSVDAPLCSRCDDGFYELFGSTACGQCNDWNNSLWLLIFIQIAAICLVAYFLFDSKASDPSTYSDKDLIKNDEKNAMSIMILKVILYFYQSLGQVLISQSITCSLLPLVSLFNLSLDYSSSSNASSGFCIFPFIKSPLFEIVISPIFVDEIQNVSKSMTVELNNLSINKSSAL